MPSKSVITTDTLLDELQAALAHGTVARRVETLHRVTDLFVSGTVDFHEADDDACLKRLRSLIALLPQPQPFASGQVVQGTFWLVAHRPGISGGTEKGRRRWFRG